MSKDSLVLFTNENGHPLSFSFISVIKYKQYSNLIQTYGGVVQPYNPNLQDAILLADSNYNTISTPEKSASQPSKLSSNTDPTLNVQRHPITRSKSRSSVYSTSQPLTNLRSAPNKNLKKSISSLAENKSHSVDKNSQLSASSLRYNLRNTTPTNFTKRSIREKPFTDSFASEINERLDMEDIISEHILSTQSIPLISSQNHLKLKLQNSNNNKGYTSDSDSFEYFSESHLLQSSASFNEAYVDLSTQSFAANRGKFLNHKKPRLLSSSGASTESIDSSIYISQNKLAESSITFQSSLDSLKQQPLQKDQTPENPRSFIYLSKEHVNSYPFSQKTRL
ncbi:hypothetical protein BB561_001885 [Smittium simulii]|uniref:Uncharacterized protein n=1 Tax=Smittium simulii TaxID=133385 RepID=A0A2T9YSS0_9FUNG|nr:hypothetical protein BB561_001885 [Smittium simulii]